MVDLRKLDRRKGYIVLGVSVFLIGLLIWDAYEPPRPERTEVSSSSGCYARGECELCSIEK